MRKLQWLELQSITVFCAVILDAVNEVWLLENGVARVPPMGWMSWGYYKCNVDCVANPDRCLDENLILRVADAMYNEGYQEAGYEYIIIDDCWSERQRSIYGRLVPDRQRFPRGMKFLADYIHSKGMKFGMYLNIAEVTCMGYPGSKGYFAEDAKMLAEYGVDYIKVDGCFNTVDYLNVAYKDLGRELQNTKRKMVYSCSWPYYIEFIHKLTPNFSQVMQYCNLWRNFYDVDMPGDWEQVKRIIKYFEKSFHKIVKYHGPGHWNDPDMLIIGTGALTMGQSRIQMVVYAMMSAPLLMCSDMSMVSEEQKKLLQDSTLIAIAQDPLGIMAKPYLVSYDLTLWVKRHLPMKGDIFPSFSFALVNFHQDTNKSTTIVPHDYGLYSKYGYTVLDVLNDNFFRNMSANESLEISAPPEDVVLFTLYPL